MLKRHLKKSLDYPLRCKEEGLPHAISKFREQVYPLTRYGPSPLSNRCSLILAVVRFPCLIGVPFHSLWFPSTTT
ncbi:hypothetical protein RRG08_040996 [Elysia crispata]|uniref:Uncharacterized protein n=1 Tax=Elysia crispata TaxID=231223 RepID=A0AAE0ZIK5_9GAST|nr:hypothetical protein RRG08_040996 [Elysia crispata]